MYKTAVIIVSAILFLQGCSGFSEKQPKPADVTSSPSGAMVYANDEELGKTPLHYELFDAFPAHWKGGVYRMDGVLVVKKDGCAEFTLKVDDRVLRKPIHAGLDCSGIAGSEKPTIDKAQPKNTEQRLEELEALYEKGVITDDERKATRVRILNEL